MAVLRDYPSATRFFVRRPDRPIMFGLVVDGNQRLGLDGARRVWRDGHLGSEGVEPGAQGSRTCGQPSPRISHMPVVWRARGWRVKAQREGAR